MYTLFLTGGIGAGKSTVCDLLRAKGAQIVSLDGIAHDVLEDPQVKLELAERFGHDVLEWPEGFEMRWLASRVEHAADLPPCPAYDVLVEAGDPMDGFCEGSGDYAQVNRRLLAERAFASAAETEALNAITHPRIMERLGSILTSGCCMRRPPKVTVVEVPLIEDAAEARVLADEIMTIACPVELRRAHAVARGMDGEDFDGRNARQITDEQRVAIADTVVANDGDPAALAAKIDAWWEAREAAGWASVRTSDPEAPAVAGTPAVVGAPATKGEAAALSAPALRSPAIAFVGRHNSGKTTLVTKVIAELAGRGVDVGSVKHHGHCGFEIDVPGKDSWRHREAGANEVAVCSPDRFALMRELEEEMECTEVVNLMRPHDVVIVEGYRRSGLPTIEIMRSGNERDALAAAEFVRAVESGDPSSFDAAVLGHDADRMPDGLTVGIASDLPEVRAAAEQVGLAAFDLDEGVPAIADYIEREVMARS